MKRNTVTESPLDGVAPGARVIRGREIGLAPWCRLVEVELRAQGPTAAHAEDQLWLCESLHLQIDVSAWLGSVAAALRSLCPGDRVRVELESPAALRVVVSGKSPSPTLVGRCAIVTSGLYVAFVLTEAFELGSSGIPAIARSARLLEAVGCALGSGRGDGAGGIASLPGAVEVDVVRLAVGARFGRAGWKLPVVDPERCWCVEGGAEPDALELRLVRAGPVSGAGDEVARVAARALARAGELLLSGDAPALSAATLAWPPEPVLRALGLDASTYVDPDGARAAVAALCAEQPDDVAARAALLRLEGRAGSPGGIFAAGRGLVEVLDRLGRGQDSIEVMTFVASSVAPDAPEAAAACLDSALERAPTEPVVLRARAKVARQLGDVVTFGRCLAGLLDHPMPDRVRARIHAELGRISLAVLGDTDRAARHFGEADAIEAGGSARTTTAITAVDGVDTVPTASAWRPPDDRLAVLRGRGPSEELIDALEAAARFSTSPAERAAFKRELGMLLYFDFEDTERAAPHLVDALELDTDGTGADPGALSALESVFAERGDPRRRDVLELQRARAEGDAWLHLTLILAELHSGDGDHAAALREAQAALSRTPRASVALRAAAQAHLGLGRTGRARETLIELLSVPELEEHERVDALLTLADIERALGKLADAAARLEEVLRVRPGDARAIDALDATYAALDLWPERTRLAGHRYALHTGRGAGGFALGTPPPGALTRADREGAVGALLDAIRFGAQAPDPAADRYWERAIAIAAEDPQLLEACLETARGLGARAAIGLVARRLGDQMLPGPARDAIVAEAARAESARPGWTGDPAPTPGAAGVDPRARADALADAGDLRGALSVIAALIPGARVPAERRELLLRKGRWLLDAGDDGRAASLPLKGALILAPAAADVRLELMRAACAQGEASVAVDQLREYLDATGASVPPAEERARLAEVLVRLRALPRAPVDAWVRDLVSESAPALSRALWPQPAGS